MPITEQALYGAKSALVTACSAWRRSLSVCVLDAQAKYAVYQGTDGTMNMHENFDRAFEVEGSSDRSFGIVIAVFFALVAVLPAVRGSPSSIRWWAVAVAAAFLITALLWSRVLHPLNRLWHRLGLLLAKIVSPIVLALVFFAIMAPLGRLMRALGKDPLRLRRSDATSYWIVRQPPGPSPESMENQF